MVIDGGAQALTRTQSVLVVDGPKVTELTLPDLLGALVLKAAAHMADGPDGERHLRDGALLASLIHDHAGERQRLRGSDGKRIRHLQHALADPGLDAWLLLPSDARQRGLDTLRILSA